MSPWQSVALLAHSFAVGTALTAMTLWSAPLTRTNGSDSAKTGSLPERVISSSSVLFLSLGMTTVMMLVADNLARAFAIAGAVALIRFRVKMTGRLLGVSSFFGVVTGMACGVNRLDLAWITLLFFTVALGLVLAVRVRTERRQPTRTKATENVIPLPETPRK